MEHELSRIKHELFIKTITTMAKTAFLVSFCPMTRVVIECENPDRLTDEEQNLLVAKAREQILQYADEKLNGENIDEVRPDDECPYGTFHGEV